MDPELLLVIVLGLVFVSIPVVIAVVRGHAYIGVIAILSVASIVGALITGPGGLIAWAIAFAWAVWPHRSGAGSVLFDLTSSEVGQTLGSHKRMFLETSTPEELLMRLKELHNNKIISDEEFEQKRKALVDKIGIK
jgi:hypothetical protein